MSTRKIKEALSRLRSYERGPAGHHDFGYIDAADRAVEAIEKAARELLGLWGHARHDIDAEKVMESIAKEAP